MSQFACDLETFFDFFPALWAPKNEIIISNEIVWRFFKGFLTVIGWSNHFTLWNPKTSYTCIVNSTLAAFRQKYSHRLLKKISKASLDSINQGQLDMIKLVDKSRRRAVLYLFETSITLMANQTVILLLDSFENNTIRE